MLTQLITPHEVPMLSHEIQSTSLGALSSSDPSQGKPAVSLGVVSVVIFTLSNLIVTKSKTPVSLSKHHWGKITGFMCLSFTSALHLAVGSTVEQQQPQHCCRDGSTHQSSWTLGCFYEYTKVMCFQSYWNASQICKWLFCKEWQTL